MTDRKPLYVRLPADAADTLDRTAFERKVSKQDLVADLILGRAEFWPAPTDVLTLAEAAALLQTTEETVAELAASGDLPGRQLGGEWRFARAAVLAWLAPA